jgi:hypothetical protein
MIRASPQFPYAEKPVHLLAKFSFELWASVCEDLISQRVNQENVVHEGLSNRAGLLVADWYSYGKPTEGVYSCQNICMTIRHAERAAKVNAPALTNVASCCALQKTLFRGSASMELYTSLTT